MKESFAQAISAAISEEMRRDDTVLVYGEDVAEMGGIFCATKGILDEFGPKRCISTPISEGAIVGSAIVKLLARYGRDAVPYVYDYVKSMKDAVRQVCI